MKALIKQKPASKAEVFFEDSWLEWMDPDTGAPLNSDPYKYGLCLDAQSDDPDDYVLTKHVETDEDGNEVVTYTAEMKPGWGMERWPSRPPSPSTCR